MKTTIPTLLPRCLFECCSAYGPVLALDSRRHGIPLFQIQLRESVKFKNLEATLKASLVRSPRPDFSIASAKAGLERDRRGFSMKPFAGRCTVRHAMGKPSWWQLRAAHCERAV